MSFLASERQFKTTSLSHLSHCLTPRGALQGFPWWIEFWEMSHIHLRKEKLTAVHRYIDEQISDIGLTQSLKMNHDVFYFSYQLFSKAYMSQGQRSHLERTVCDVDWCEFDAWMVTFICLWGPGRVNWLSISPSLLFYFHTSILGVVYWGVT